MTFPRIRFIHGVLVASAAALAGCSGAPAVDDPFLPYLQRSDTVSLSAGNAVKANEAIQVIDPWPRYAQDTRIPGDGQRMADAVERYKDVSKLSKAPKPIAPDYSGNVGISAGATGSQ